METPKTSEKHSFSFQVNKNINRKLYKKEEEVIKTKQTVEAVTQTNPNDKSPKMIINNYNYGCVNYYNSKNKSPGIQINEKNENSTAKEGERVPIHKSINPLYSYSIDTSKNNEKISENQIYDEQHEILLDNIRENLQVQNYQFKDM